MDNIKISHGNITQKLYLNISLFVYIPSKVRLHIYIVAETPIQNMNLVLDTGSTGIHVSNFALLGGKSCSAENTLELGVRTARANLDITMNNQ